MHFSYVVLRNYPMKNAFHLPILYKSMVLEMIIMTFVSDLQNVNKSSLGITLKQNQMCRKCQTYISYEKQKTVKSSGRIPLATYVQNTCIMNTDNLESETKENSTGSTDESNNLINNFIDLLDELNSSTNDDHSIFIYIC